MCTLQVEKPDAGNEKPQPARHPRLPNPERDDSVLKSKQQHDLTSFEVSDKDKGKLDEIEACQIEWSDAISALNRAKTDECKRKIKRVTCLAQKNNLYEKNIERTCPLDPADVGAHDHEAPHRVPAHPTVPEEDVRIVFVFVVHGRAFRQFRRLFKAVYNTRHYIYIHVDSVSDPVGVSLDC